MSRAPVPPHAEIADRPGVPSRPGRSLQERGIERLTGDCLAMTTAEAAARIDREVASAIESSRWDDAIKWQRVRLRVKRMQSRGAS